MKMAHSANSWRSDCDNCEREHSSSIHLHQEIEDLKQQLLQRDYYILQMETSVLMTADKYPRGEYAALNEELAFWQEKYERLIEGHKKLQKVNQGLEDKLLKIVDKYETEKSALNRDITSLTSRLVEARITIAELEEENEQYRNDCNVAVQLLQCKPSNFVSHKVDTLPMDLQQKVRSHLGQSQRGKQQPQDPYNGQAVNGPDVRMIRVPIPTFPPTAMVYSVSKSELGDNGENNAPVTTDVVSAAVMAKVLEERAKERNFQKPQGASRCHCGANKSINTEDRGTQTKWTFSADIWCNKEDERNCGCRNGDTTPSRQWAYSTSSTTSTETEI